MSIETHTGDDFRPSDLVGAAIQRREDPHLITGEAGYTDDLSYPRLVYLAIVRSQYGHANIVDIDTSEAEAMDGVVRVVTFADIDASESRTTMRKDSPDYGTGVDYPLLAEDKVTFQGQAIAGVVATDRYVARDAVEAVDVEYDRLDAVVDPKAALEDGAPQIHEEVPGNLAFDWERGDREAVADALDIAEHVVEFETEINRVLPTAMEPRGALARYSRSDGTLDVEMSTQNPHQVKSDLAGTLMVPEGKVRVRPADVGGGFGAKLQPYTGHLLAGWCAIELGRQVKWVSTRTEDCASMIHSRHHIIRATAAVDSDGEILGVTTTNTVPVGGVMVPGGSNVPANLGRMANGQYDIPAFHVHIRGAYTNTAPLGAYRGAGRPEATFFIERLIRTVADDLGMDPITVRRRNFIQPDEFPYDAGLGREYDNGEYEMNLDVALDEIGYEDFREYQADLREEGRYVGLGVSCYVEACGASPGWHETGTVEMAPDGSVVVKTGTAEIGTGHQTAYAQIAARILGVPYDDVEIIEGDTAHVMDGGGTAGSRAMAVGGSAVHESAEKVVEKAREIAAYHLETAPADLEFDHGEFHVRGAPDRSVPITNVAAAAYDTDYVPEGMELGLQATSYYDPPNYTFPFGTHVAIVEVDPETGEIAFERYLAVDDVGNQINPKILEGQIHGGVAQGIGQAILEGVQYDENGTLLTGSLQDYAIPKAFDIPELEWDSTVTPAPHNPLGVKGVGEAGAIAAPPAVVNAVIDALRPLGVTSMEMPMTAERVWDTIQSAN